MKICVWLCFFFKKNEEVQIHLELIQTKNNKNVNLEPTPHHNNGSKLKCIIHE